MIATLKELIGEDFLCPFCKVKLSNKPNNKWFHNQCPRFFDIVMGNSSREFSIRFSTLENNNLAITVFQNGETWITELSCFNRQTFFLTYNSFDIDYIEQKIKTIMVFQ